MNMVRPSEWPAVLLRRWLLSAAAGLGFLIAGLVIFLAANDRTLLALSILLTLFTVQRSVSFYRMAAKGAFETVEGVCIGIKRMPLRKQQSVCLLAQDGTERTVLLDKQARLVIGNRYRLYFQQDPAGMCDSIPFQEYLSQDLFLGLEDLGEYHAEME
jgi:hypothetical protein